MQRTMLRLACSLLVLTLAACSENNPAGLPGGGTLTGSMRATVDGSTWTAVSVVAQRSGSLISIAGSDTGPTGIGFAMIESGTGTFTILGAEALSANVTNTATTWTSTSGEVTFTALTADRAVGTFSFAVELAVGTGAAARTVTNGVFDVTF